MLQKIAPPPQGRWSNVNCASGCPLAGPTDSVVRGINFTVARQGFFDLRQNDGNVQTTVSLSEHSRVVNVDDSLKFLDRCRHPERERPPDASWSSSAA